MAIVIIADDLSGAAELAGIAHAHGYVAEVHRDFDAASDAEVIAVDTDSRGLLPEAAADRVRQAAREILAAKPAWLFKKVDSLLRGNVRAEIEALLDATGQGQAVLIPANPSRGRTIVRGELRIDGVPLHETALAGEPQHPRRTSRVAELISGDSLPTESIDAPDVATAEELLHHAASYDDTTLAAGAADFFAALLAQRGARRQAGSGVNCGLDLPNATPVTAIDSRPHEAPQLPTLLVCGSRAAWPQRSAECLAAGVPVAAFLRQFSAAPAEGQLHDWAAISASQLKAAGKLLLGIGPGESAAAPAELLARLAALTAMTIEQAPVATLLLEGGATAAAVAFRLGWSRFAVAADAPAGIGVLHPLDAGPAPRVWIKPGTYPWPQAVWRGLQ